VLKINVRGQKEKCGIESSLDYIARYCVKKKDKRKEKEKVLIQNI
jgi:hypothetical protein